MPFKFSTWSQLYIHTVQEKAPSIFGPYQVAETQEFRKVLNINSFLCKTVGILVGILTQQKALPKFVLVEPACYKLSCLERTLNGTCSYPNSRHYENAYHCGLS